jgi:hypothetical protein
MKQRAVSQTCRAVSLPPLVDQKWKTDAALLAKYLGIAHIAEANGGQGSPFVAECGFVVAQLRDVLAAEDSAVVAKEHDNRRPVGPQ